MTKETFEQSITLMDIVMRENDIYCEYNDGDLVAIESMLL